MSMTRDRGFPDAATTGIAGTTSSAPSTAPASPTLPRPTRDRASAALTILFEKVAAGEKTAFAELYDATAARVYGLALRIVRNPAQAEEVSQESYVKIWRTSNRFDPRRGSSISWILMITHAAAVDRVRSAQASTRREDSYEQQVQALVWARPNPTHDLACASLEASRVHDALAELSAVQRDTLVLAYFSGCTQSEIADRLAIPLGTAKTRIRDGLIRLRALVEEP